MCLFPSPQGGSETLQKRDGGGGNKRFPSPQGGSETVTKLMAAADAYAFPSPQGGSETAEGCCICGAKPIVSIPSRRVGDVYANLVGAALKGFHPLKAGRRQSILSPELMPEASFHPLKAGRRLTRSARP